MDWVDRAAQRGGQRPDRGREAAAGGSLQLSCVGRVYSSSAGRGEQGPDHAGLRCLHRATPGSQGRVYGQ